MELLDEAINHIEEQRRLHLLVEADVYFIHEYEKRDAIKCEAIYEQEGKYYASLDGREVIVI